MTINKFHLYLADLGSPYGTEPGKVRPVVVVQTDILNRSHPSTIVCPLSSQVLRDSSVLSVFVPKNETGLKVDSDILVDQIRAIDNNRFIKPIGVLSPSHQSKLLENLQILILE